MGNIPLQQLQQLQQALQLVSVDELIDQIRQLQSESLSLIPRMSQHMLFSEAATMQDQIGDAVARCASLKLLLTTLESESETLLGEDAAPAMDALLTLIHNIGSLHQVTQGSIAYRETSTLAGIQARAPFLNACKSQSRVVFSHFRSLYEKARNLTQRFTGVTTDLAFEIASAQERIERVQNMMQRAVTLREGAENELAIWSEQRDTARVHIQEAMETIRSAERKRESMESARVVRNIFTFGLGEVFDFFDLNEEIEEAERTVARAEENAQQCEQSIQRAVAAVQQINGELMHLGMLGAAIRDQNSALQACMTHEQTIRTRTINLTNASLDVSRFVGTLAARSETFAVHHTAQEFARSVLGFGSLMASEERLDGLLLQHDPEMLREILDMIAWSDGDDGIAENGNLLGTQHSLLAIDDLM